MPYLQTATSSMNTAFSPDNIAELGGDTAELYRPGAGVSLSEALARTPKTDLSDEILAYIDTWPSAVQTAVQAAIFDNLTRGARVPITFAWQPAYDFSVTIHDVTDTARSQGGITMVLTSRYPADTHPLAGATAS